MPSAFFAALARDTTAAVDEVMAEAWTLMPRKPGRDRTAGDGIDPDRPVTAFVATFADPEAKPGDLTNGYDRRQVRRPGEETGHPRLIVSPSAVAALAIDIVAGDLLLRQADGVTWRVSTAFALAGGSLKLGLNIVG